MSNVVRHRSRPKPRVNDNKKSKGAALSPTSNELVVAVIGYAGSGCSQAADVIRAALYEKKYEVHKVKISQIIVEEAESSFVTINDDVHAGRNRLKKAKRLQNEGDEIRRKKGGHALAAYAIRRIKTLRGKRQTGSERLAFIIDSIKHPDEVELLREVYGPSFRLVAVHCDKDIRFSRLHGDLGSGAKFPGTNEQDVYDFMERDERDRHTTTGQQVLKAFEKADFFIANEDPDSGRLKLNAGLKRFFDLILGDGFHRPTPQETAMHAAFSIALRSSCLSRQVGAALISADGQLVAVGSNDVPRFGGGTYLEGSDPDNRCAVWEWSDHGITFRGCHNSRHKMQIQEEVRHDIIKNIEASVRSFKESNKNTELPVLDSLHQHIASYFNSFESKPISDLTEFSRSIHAEMDTVLSAARSGHSPHGSTLFCTTYPCHNCARHLVTAGVHRVYYVEPYVKSLATTLHYDAIRRSPTPPNEGQIQMEILPFTGVGHRMYEDFFSKRVELKASDGSFRLNEHSDVPFGARLNALEVVEESAADLV